MLPLGAGSVSVTSAEKVKVGSEGVTEFGKRA